MMRLPAGLSIIGAGGVHRSGWPYAIDALTPLLSDSGLLVDDFVERTFLYASKHRRTWRERWVGMFHHPPQMPSWFLSRSAEQVLTVREFIGSRRWLVGAVALSSHLGAWLRETLRLPVAVLKHPSEVPAQQFDLGAYLAQPTLVQVGWYLRNQDGIFQVPVPDGMQKIRLRPQSKSATEARQHMRARGPYRMRQSIGEVATLDHLPASAYDQLLARSVVFGEYLSASASNTVVECIARCTPMVLNRMPAHEEYLGRDYPLFFEHLKDVPALLTPERVGEAHAYLQQMDRSWLDGAVFCDGMRAFVSEVA